MRKTKILKIPVRPEERKARLEGFKKKRENKIKQILLLSFISFSFLSATETIPQDFGGPGDTARNFQQNIIAKAYDRYRGTFYVATGANNGIYTIAKADRTTIPTTGFTALANEAVFGGPEWTARNSVAGRIYNPLFGILRADGTEATHIVAINEDQNNTGDNRYVYTITLADNGAISNRSPQLVDALGNQIQGAEVDSVLRLATGRDTTNNTEKVFVRVYPTGGANNFERDGFAESGVACLTLNPAVDNLVLANANAVRLDVTTFELGGLSGGGGNLATAQVEDMFWDDELQKLYVGLNVTSNNNAQDSFCNGIVKAELDGAGAGFLQGFQTVSALPARDGDPGANTRTDKIFIVRQNVAFAGAPVARINKIRTMKTSTGIKYLIVNGGAGRITNVHVGNLIYALRLGANGNIVRNDDGNALLVGWTANNLGATQVGGEAIPFAGNVNSFISDMEVVGDTVYVSFKDADRGALNDPGVWSSTAMFDHQGIIIGWTRWERVFPSTQDPAADPNLTDKAWFFSVDAQTGKLWQVNEEAAGNPRVVNRSTIKTLGFAATSLQTQLNRDLSDGCTCVLDLSKNTPGISRALTRGNSFTLFGGIEKVAFGRTKYGATNAVTRNFGDADDPNANNFKVTNLQGAGVVRCLGYSRDPVGVPLNTGGYFFAGTDRGLYVYAASAVPHTGFDTTAAAGGLTTLQAVPFDGNSEWMQMAADRIIGPVTAIESNGTHLFVVEQDVTTPGSILHRFTLQNDVATMEQDANYLLIAQSGTDPIPANTIFTGFKIVTATNGARANHRGVISTNAGIYVSNQDLADGIGLATWVARDAGNAYHSIYTPKRTPVPPPVGHATSDGACHRIWGFALADDSRGLSYYQNSRLQQFGFEGGRTSATPQPGNYSSGDLAAGTAIPTYLDRSTHFWTDGGRRFYTCFNANDTVYNALHSLPYYGAEWNMTGPESFSQLNGIRIHWIENISGLGIVLAGTDTGVISLVE